MQTHFRLIRTESEHAEALRRIDELMGSVEPGSAEGDELEVLALIVEDYEERHFPMPDADPIQAVSIRMGERGLRQRDMLDVFGSESLASQVLRGKRRLTVDMIVRLHEKLGIPLRILLRTPLRENQPKRAS